MKAYIEDLDLDEAFNNASPKTRAALDHFKRDVKAMFKSHLEVLKTIDISAKGNWGPFIVASQAVLSPQELMRELGASVSTLHRWANDGVAPSEGARVLMKKALIEAITCKINGQPIPDMGKPDLIYQ